MSAVLWVVVASAVFVGAMLLKCWLVDKAEDRAAERERRSNK